MAKSKESTKKVVTRREVAHKKKDAELRRTLIQISVAVLGVIILIVAYGLVNEYIIKAQAPIVKIGDAEIATRDFQARVRYERSMANVQLVQYQTMLDQLAASGNTGENSFYQQIQYMASSLEQQLAAEYAESFAEQILEQMVEEELIRQEAQKRGLVASTEEIDIRAETMMGYDREAVITDTETLTGTAAPMTKAEYDETYAAFKENVLQINNFSEEQYRRMLETNVLYSKVQEAISSEAETEAEQVEIVYLAAGTEAEAQALKERLENGESATDLTTELLDDDDDLTLGQSFPWLPRGYLSLDLGDEFENAAFDTPVGSASDVIADEEMQQYYVIYVSGHEVRELSESFLSQAQQEKYTEWVTAQKAELVEYLDWQKAVPEL